MLRIMVSELVFFAIKCRNMFPSPNGISTTLSPLAIVTGADKPDFTHLQLEFGTFVHIFNDNNPTNTMAQRTTGAIALNSTGNTKGGYFFLNLETGKRVPRHQWTVLPMPNSVMQQVHFLGLRDNMPLLKDYDLLFERRPGVPLDDSTLADEALDLLRFGDEGGDGDFVPSAAPAADVPLLHDADVSLQELADLHNDLAPAPSASDDASFDIGSVVSTASSVSSSVEEERESEYVLELHPDLLPRTVSSERGVPTTTDSTPAPPERGAATTAKSTATSPERGAAVTANFAQQIPTIERDTGATDIEGGATGTTRLNQNTTAFKKTTLTKEKGGNEKKGHMDLNESKRGAITKNQTFPNKEERASLKFDLKDETGITNEDDGSTVNDDRTIIPSTPESSYTYNLRDRSEIGQKPKFNDQFDNPASSKSYAPHLQFFQQSVSGMIDDPQRFHNHLCELHEHVVAFSFFQMSERDGVRKQGEAAVLALFREFAQLHEKRVF